jgi:hypothetical protein
MKRPEIAISSYLVWRVITTVATVLAVGSMLLSAILYDRLGEVVALNRATIESNEALVCAFADLVQLSSRQAPPVGSTHHLEAQAHFLETILGAKCPNVEARPKVVAEIEESITDIETELDRRERE